MLNDKINRRNLRRNDEGSMEIEKNEGENQPVQVASAVERPVRRWTDDEKKVMRDAYKDGDWVFGIGSHKGCSEVFEGYGFLQPFEYLNDFDPTHFRLATHEEIEEAKTRCA